MQKKHASGLLAHIDDGEAVSEASLPVPSYEAAWPMASVVDIRGLAALDELQGGDAWGGPLIVSMPRTGSTLMGALFLFARDPRSTTSRRFARYLHEPAAPVYWRGGEVGDIARFITTPLTGRDIVQESAYQFAHPEIARWFLTRARRPVVFTLRHPRLAWPSRWRVMLGRLAAESPDDPNADAARRALAENDFSRLGPYLTDHVRPPDNGFYAFLSLAQICLDEGIEFVIVDNTRFRDHPARTLRELCERLDYPFDAAMVEWKNLDPVRSGVVMSDLAAGEEYEWYYARTLASDRGILAETHTPLDLSRFPDSLRGTSRDCLTIDEAVGWYELLLARPETLG